VSADYVILIEEGDGNLGAWCPDLPGVVAVGDTVEECVTSMAEAIAFHIEGMREDGLAVPSPSRAATIHVDAA
jgi:predicted RNase H-like HicB family nuclease